MIASASTSQVKYIVNKDSLVCYTNEENRTIARLFVKGDYYKELYLNADSTLNIVAMKDSLLIKQTDEYYKELGIYFDELYRVNKDNSKLVTRQKSLLKQRNYGIVSIFGLIVIILIK